MEKPRDRKGVRAMANWDHMILKATNTEKFKEIMQDFNPPVGITDPEWIDGDSISFRASPLPDEYIKEISAKHPDITFEAICSFEATWYDELYTVEFKAGVDKVGRV